MNPTRILKEILLLNSPHRGITGTKGDGVQVYNLLLSCLASAASSQNLRRQQKLRAS
jgi:hypothetical protein